jgi:hypothetical protein
MPGGKTFMLWTKGTLAACWGGATIMLILHQTGQKVPFITDFIKHPHLK